MNRRNAFLLFVVLAIISSCQSKSGQNSEKEAADSPTMALTEDEKAIYGVIEEASMNNFMLITTKGDTVIISTMDQNPDEIGGFEPGDTVKVYYIEEEEEPGSKTIPTAIKVIVTGKKSLKDE